MPRITLQLGIEGSADVARSLQGLTTAARTAFASMKAEANAAANSILQGHHRIIAGEQQTLNARRLIMAQAVNSWKTSEAAMIAAVVQGSSNRLRLVQNEVTQRKQLLDSIRNTASQTEQAVTRTIEEEARKRIAAQAAVGAAATAASRAGAGGSGGGRSRGEAPSSAPAGGGFSHRAAGLASSAVSATIGAGFHAMDMMHDARYRRAATMENVLQATTQVTGSRGAGQAVMAQITAAAREHGIDANVLAQSVLGAQTEFAALGSRSDYAGLTQAQQIARLTGGDPSQNGRGGVAGIIAGAVRGRNLGSNPAEFARLQAMFNQQGIRGGANDNLLASFVAAAQTGAVETGAVTRTAMQPIMARMQMAATAAEAEFAPGMSDADKATARSEAMSTAGHRAFVEMQVLASRGFSPRNAGNVLRTTGQALTSNVTAERMQRNIRAARESATGPLRGQLGSLLGTGANGLFEDDPNQRGHSRLRQQYHDGVELASGLSSAGLNPTQMGNIFAGSGTGNAQALQRNMRAIIGSLMANNAQGVSGFEAVKTIANTRLSGADEAGMRDTFENSPMATFVRQEEQRLTALTDNTGALGRLSERLDRFRADHPLAAPVIEGAATLAVSAGAGQLAGRVAARNAARTAARTAERTAARTAASRAAETALRTAGGAEVDIIENAGQHAAESAAEHVARESASVLVREGEHAGGGVMSRGLRLLGRAARSPVARGLGRFAGGALELAGSSYAMAADIMLSTRDLQGGNVAAGEAHAGSRAASMAGSDQSDIAEHAEIQDRVRANWAETHPRGGGVGAGGGGPGGGGPGVVTVRLDPASAAAVGQATAQHLQGVTLRTEATPAAAVSAGTQGASTAANRTASPQ